MAQNVYLANMEFEEAIRLFFNKIGKRNVGSEKLETWKANGRISAAAVYAAISSPHYNASAMDGIAVESVKTYKASERNPIVLCEGSDYMVVDTGDPIVKPFDSVIMVEDLIEEEKGKVKIYKSIAPWQNIRPIGEDIIETQLIIPTNHTIRPVDIGAMMAGGVNSIEVYKKPVVGILPTGTEIVKPGTELKVGDIIDFNSSIFSSQVEEWGGISKKYDIVSDDYIAIKKHLIKAAQECDVVIINGGSSAGREDFTSAAIQELGEVFVHGVAIKPGKPVILGSIEGKPVIGIPGYPVSAYVCMEYIVKRIVEAFANRDSKENKTVNAILSRRVMSSLKHLEFVRVKLGYVGEKLMATPLSRGAGVTMSLVNADGILEVLQNVEGLESGTEVKIKLLKEEEEIKSTLVCIGSHDPIIDILSDLIHIQDRKFFLSSAHVGSMGGIMALRAGETHLAPIHLLDMESGEYNISYIHKYLKGRDIALIKGVKRVQGLIVKRGNDFDIQSIEEVAGKRLRFVNRQQGSGTRLLLDYQMKRFNIKIEDLIGYEREEYTHLGVASAVLAGDADCGLGVYSAAKIMDLDFIPLCNEEYDFAVPKEYLDTPLIQTFLNTIKSKAFVEKLEQMGGYEYTDIGKIVYP